MTYTFTEDEIKIFLNWSVYAQGEKNHLEPEEEQMIRRLNKIVRKDFDELSNEDKVYRFCEKKMNIRLVGIVQHILRETIILISSLKKKVRNL